MPVIRACKSCGQKTYAKKYARASESRLEPDRNQK